MSNETLTEGQIKFRQEREQELIDYQRSLYERSVARQEREKAALKPKSSALSEEDRIKEAQARHQAGVDRQAQAQQRAQVAARETAENNARALAELKLHQAAALKPEKERGVCPTCGEAVDLGLAFHRRGDPTLHDYCPIDAKKALASGRFSREQLQNLGCSL